MKRSKVTNLVAAGFLSVAAASAAAELPDYQFIRFTELGAFNTRILDINNLGQVTGSTMVLGPNGQVVFDGAFISDGKTIQSLGAEGLGFSISNSGLVGGTGLLGSTVKEIHAFFWNGSSVTDLGTLGGPSSIGVDINESGWITGESEYDTSGAVHAFVWDGATLRDLGDFGGGDSRGHAINNAGQVTGLAVLPSGFSHAFLWDGLVMHDLGTLGGIGSSGDAINDAGHVTGFATTASNEAHAFLWNGTSMSDLGTLGGSSSFSEAINEAGQVAGWSSTSESRIHAFLWEGTRMVDLGTLGGPDTFSMGLAINELGHVAGRAGSHAFVWDGTKMRDLGTVGAQSSEAIAINDAGVVAGNLETADGDRDAFIATPIALLFDRLLADVAGVGPGKSLANKVRHAHAYYDADDKQATCSMLSGFIQHVTVQRGKRIADAKADGLVADARRILDAIGCA